MAGEEKEFPTITLTPHSSQHVRLTDRYRYGVTPQRAIIDKTVPGSKAACGLYRHLEVALTVRFPATPALQIHRSERSAGVLMACSSSAGLSHVESGTYLIVANTVDHHIRPGGDPCIYSIIQTFTCTPEKRVVKGSARPRRAVPGPERAESEPGFARTLVNGKLD